MAAAAETEFNAHDYLTHLRQGLASGPTLRDARVWGTMDRIERSFLLSVAGYSKRGQFNGRGRSDVQVYRATEWYDLPDTVRSRVKRAARRLAGRLGQFEVIHSETESGKQGR